MLERPAQTIHGILEAIVAGANANVPPHGMTTRIIAIDGAGGAGKSTLAKALAKALGNVQVVHTDDFASWDNAIDWWPRLVQDVLEPLSRNQRCRYRKSDWQGIRQDEWEEIKPGEFVILEGVTATRVELRRFITYSIWIHTPRRLRLRRGIERDGEHMRSQWEAWMSEEDRYIRRERPALRADLVLRGDQDVWT